MSAMTSVDFLRTVHPRELWALVAIDPDGKGIETRTFSQDTEAECTAWLEKWLGKRNLYWHIGRVASPLKKKGERKDIKAAAYLHVDLDPRAGEDLDTERKRIFSLITDRLPAGVLPPTWIVFSGGGYQCGWKLREPIEIDGDLGKAEEAAAYNIQLEVLLGGDATHDVSRILRLPATLNLPGEKKKKKGRSVVMADVVEYHDDRVYDLSQFTPADIVQAADEASKLSIETSNVARLSSTDDLDPWEVSTYIKALIAQGRDPNDATKYPSRSEVVWAVVCDLVRQKVPDEIIFSILTDPEFGVSESILEKGPRRSEAYALKQIRDAKDENIDPLLHEMNTKHAVILHLGGDTCVVTEAYDPVFERPLLRRKAFPAFEREYMNKPHTIDTDKNGRAKKIPRGKWWLNHPGRREYESLQFTPGRNFPDVYNLWKGFKYEAKPGDCSLFLTHVRDNICCGNEEHFTYIMGWMARTVQKPGSPGEVAVVLRGDQGTGKSFFANAFGSLFGQHYLKISQPSHLVGNFNGHLQDVAVLFADEGFYAGDKKHGSVLKDLITGMTLTIERKGVDVEQHPNYMHVIMASNSDWIVPAGVNERRFFVLDVDKAHMQDSDYFRRINKQLENSGYEALLYTLMTHDTSDFNVRAVPQTKALKEQKDFTKPAETQWWQKKLVDARVFDADKDWSEVVLRKDLYEDYLDAMSKLRSVRAFSPGSFGLMLKRFLPEGWPQMRQKRLSKNAVPARIYLLPTLAVCRKHWDDNFSGPHDWDTLIEDETTPGAEVF
jgi:hypothetical protein